MSRIVESRGRLSSSHTVDPSGSDSVMLGYEQDVDSQRHTSLSPPLHRSPSHQESGIATHKSGHRAAVDVPVDLSVLKGLDAQTRSSGRIWGRSFFHHSGRACYRNCAGVHQSAMTPHQERRAQGFDQRDDASRTQKTQPQSFQIG